MSVIVEDKVVYRHCDPTIIDAHNLAAYCRNGRITHNVANKVLEESATWQLQKHISIIPIMFIDFNKEIRTL